MRVEGQQRKRDGINNERFIKWGGEGGIFCVVRADCECSHCCLCYLEHRMHHTIRLKALSALLHAWPLLFPGNLVCIVRLFALYL